MPTLSVPNGTLEAQNKTAPAGASTPNRSLATATFEEPR